jgi:pimeloyl-ACP methyl ester carboxylesterase
MAGPLKPRLVSVGSADVAVMRLGRPDAPPLVLVHGFSGDMMTWQFNIAALARDFHVVALDLPGHGGSSGARGIGHWRVMIGWLVEALSALGLRRAHLVGHSLGGRLVLGAAEEGFAASSVTLVACAGISPSYDYDFLCALSRIGTLDEARACARRLFGTAPVDIDRFARSLLAKLSDKAAQDHLDLFLAHNFVEGKLLPAVPIAWGRVAAPIQFIWGADDTIVAMPPADWLPPGAPRHLLPESGHLPHMAAADTVNRLIADFALAAERKALCPAT